MSRGLLVVGGESVLGASLTRHWQDEGRKVEWTSRRTAGATAGLRLDLADPPEAWPDLAGFDAAVLCAGITRQESCRQDPAGTRRINVDATLLLARRLVGQGGFVVFLSSNLVFDGRRPFCLPDDPVSPRTEYGRQKAEVEAGLRTIPGPSAVVRLTKVFHPGLLLLRSWVEALRGGRTITAFADYFCAPIGLSAAVELVARIAVERREGIWQASGPVDIAYTDLALLLAGQLGVSSALVNRANAGETIARGEGQGPHTTLDSTRARSELGVSGDAPELVLAECLAAMSTSGA